MQLLKHYENIKNILNGKNTNKTNLFQSISLITSIMESWLETYEYTKDFDTLMYTIKDDYQYSGTIYRGITLSKDNNWKDKIHFKNVQSFSKDKKTAISFATNNMVTENEDINIIKDSKEVIPILIELKDKNIGIDLEKFSKDLIYVCENLIEDSEEIEDLKELLSYATEEKEVLVYPNNLVNNANIKFMKIKDK